jgi:hypothetical protein
MVYIWMMLYGLPPRLDRVGWEIAEAVDVVVSLVLRRLEIIEDSFRPILLCLHF